jgi:hypothetical protein
MIVNFSPSLSFPFSLVSVEYPQRQAHTYYTPKMSSEAAVSYAALILADAEIEITSDKLLALTKAAGVEVDSVSIVVVF